MQEVDASFGSKRVRLQQLIDASKTITPEDKEKLDARLKRFEHDFPQLIFATYIADLPENVNLRELGFWLSNRAIIDSPRSNENLILLCINNQHLSASLTLGYFAEQHLDEPEIRQILEQAKPYLAARRFAPLIFSCVSALTRILRQPEAIA